MLDSRRTLNSQGYVLLGRMPLEHIVFVERAMGKPLRAGAEVHHVNRVRSDNGRGNLVACHDRAYHMLLHMRQRALDACGHADWRKCFFCKQYDNPSRMTERPGRPGNAQYVHAECSTIYCQKRWLESRARVAARMAGRVS